MHATTDEYGFKHTSRSPSNPRHSFPGLELDERADQRAMAPDTAQSFSDIAGCAYCKHKQKKWGVYNSTTLQSTPGLCRMILSALNVANHSHPAGYGPTLTSLYRYFVCNYT